MKNIVCEMSKRKRDNDVPVHYWTRGVRPDLGPVYLDPGFTDSRPAAPLSWPAQEDKKVLYSGAPAYFAGPAYFDTTNKSRWGNSKFRSWPEYVDDAWASRDADKASFMNFRTGNRSYAPIHSYDYTPVNETGRGPGGKPRGKTGGFLPELQATLPTAVLQHLFINGMKGKYRLPKQPTALPKQLTVPKVSSRVPKQGGKVKKAGKRTKK